MFCHWSYKYLFSGSKDVFSAFDDKNTNHLYCGALFFLQIMYFKWLWVYWVWRKKKQINRNRRMFARVKYKGFLKMSSVWLTSLCWYCFLKDAVLCFVHKMGKISSFNYFWSQYKPLIYSLNAVEFMVSTSIYFCSPSADKAKIRAAHRRIMILNHPDKGKYLFIYLF